MKTISKPNNRNEAPSILSSSAWEAIFKEEETDLIVQDLIDEIVGKARSIVFERYIQRRVVPFAVQSAKQDLLSALEYFFFRVDKGEENISEDTTWFIDEGKEGIDGD
jgi:hypothetical protein